MGYPYAGGDVGKLDQSSMTAFGLNIICDACLVTPWATFSTRERSAAWSPGALFSPTAPVPKLGYDCALRLHGLRHVSRDAVVKIGVNRSAGQVTRCRRHRPLPGPAGSGPQRSKWPA